MFKVTVYINFPQVLQNLAYTAWDVSNVENMAGMFLHCENFKGSVDRWNTSKVKNMDRMFSNCHNFNSSLNTKDIKDSNGKSL